MGQILDHGDDVIYIRGRKKKTVCQFASLSSQVKDD